MRSFDSRSSSYAAQRRPVQEYSNTRKKSDEPELLSTPLKSGTAPLNFFEVWPSSTGKVHTRNGVLQASQVDAWLDLKDGYEILNGEGDFVKESDIVLRLVGCDFWNHPFALGCGNPAFEMIREAFDLHETSEDAIMNNNGAFGRYLTRDQESTEISGLGT